jgi:hypothetical protein
MDGALTVPDDAAPSLKKVEMIFLESKQQGPEKVAQNLHVFLPYLTSRFPCMRMICVEALAFLDPADLVQYGPALTGRLGDMDNDVCYHALRTLNRLPPDDLAQISGAIVKLLRDEDVDIQLAALETLGTMEPQVLVPHFHAIKWSSIDCVGKTQSMAIKLLAKVEREAPRVVITVRPRLAHNASSCWIECTGMNGNTVLVVQLDRSTTCGELQAMVCEHLGLLSFQVELVLSDASILSRMVDTCLGDLLSPMEQ